MHEDAHDGAVSCTRHVPREVHGSTYDSLLNIHLGKQKVLPSSFFFGCILFLTFFVIVSVSLFIFLCFIFCTITFHFISPFTKTIVDRGRSEAIRLYFLFLFFCLAFFLLFLLAQQTPKVHSGVRLPPRSVSALHSAFALDNSTFLPRKKTPLWRFLYQNEHFFKFTFSPPFPPPLPFSSPPSPHPRNKWIPSIASRRL